MKKTSNRHSKPKSQSQTISSRCDLLFPVGRIAQMLKKGRYADRISKKSAIYLTAVLEYLVAEVIDIALVTLQQKKKARIEPGILLEAMRSDHEVATLFQSKVVLIPMKNGKGFGGDEINRGQQDIIADKLKARKKK